MLPHWKEEEATTEGDPVDDIVENGYVNVTGGAPAEARSPSTDKVMMKSFACRVCVNVWDVSSATRRLSRCKIGCHNLYPKIAIVYYYI